MTNRRDRTLIAAVFTVFTLLLVSIFVQNAYLANRFTHHSQTVDARLVERIEIECIGAGGGLVASGQNTWLVEFPTPTGLHQTRLVHPCDVTPPDFGRGRGYMWMQYDVDDYDRTRVLNDTKAEDSLLPLGIGLAGWAVVMPAAWWLFFRRPAAKPTKN